MLYLTINLFIERNIKKTTRKKLIIIDINSIFMKIFFSFFCFKKNTAIKIFNITVNIKNKIPLKDLV